MPQALRHERAHDYQHLIRRWRKVARGAEMRFAPYAESGGQEIFCLDSRQKKDAPAIYLSAGIHGDEVGATEGLIVWAEKNGAILRDWNVLIFPCLNPWGLIANSRLDSEGRDLNRSFHDETVPQVAAHKVLLGARRFEYAMTLHEDYDARGFYVYEVPGPKPYWGEHFTKVVRRHLPIEARRSIEGRAACRGIVRRAISTNLMPTWPEAFLLYFAHSERVFTAETPSEFHLNDRVAAQAALLAEAAALGWKTFSKRTAKSSGKSPSKI